VSETFAALLVRRLPETWGEPFSKLLDSDTVLRPRAWEGPPLEAWIEGCWSLGGTESTLWIGTTRELAFHLSARLMRLPAGRVGPLLAEPGDPAMIQDAFGEWGNLAVAYLADLFRAAFGPATTATRTVVELRRPEPPRGEVLDFWMSWDEHAGPLRVVFS